MIMSLKISIKQTQTLSIPVILVFLSVDQNEEVCWNQQDTQK